MFFSISPDEYYYNLQNELWGCFKHIGMPWDMVMSLPIQERRAYIQRHNAEQDSANMQKIPENQRTYEGESINKFAEMDMMKKRNL